MNLYKSTQLIIKYKTFYSVNYITGLNQSLNSTIKNNYILKSIKLRLTLFTIKCTAYTRNRLFQYILATLKYNETGNASTFIHIDLYATY